MGKTLELNISATHVDSADTTSPDRSSDMDNLVHKNGKWANWWVIMNLIIIGLAYSFFGYDNALSSPLVSLPLFVYKYQGPGAYSLLIFTARNLDLIICLPLIGAAVGTIAWIPLQKYFGRKGSFLISYALYCIPGSILQLFAPNLRALVVGRVWNYVGISVLTTVGPLYLSELVPARYRARAIGFTVAEAGMIGVIATIIVWATEKINNLRQYMIPMAIQAAASVLLLLLSLLLTESPFWLLSQNRLYEGRKNLTSICTDNTMLVEAELSAGLIGLQSSAGKASKVNNWDILKPANLKRTMTAGALVYLAQVGGQILVGTYSTVILVQSGVADPFKITIIVFLLQFVGTLIGSVLIDKVGRRPTTLIGFIVLFIIDIAAGALACIGLKTQFQSLGLVSLYVIFAFVNSVSFQSISYILPTEIPTSRLHEPTMTWAAVWSYITAIITNFAIPQIMSPDAGNLRVKAFLIFSGCILVTIIWTYFYLLETANRMLGEIDELYTSSIAVNKWRVYKTMYTINTANVMTEIKTGDTAVSNSGDAV